MVIAGISRISRRPVLELMQGSAGATGNAASKMPESFVSDADVNTSSRTDTVSNYVHNVERFGSANASKRRGTLRFIYRHIVRSMLKSVLAAVVALSILVALVFFSETIVRTENDIDRLYTTTIVNARVAQVSPNDNNFIRFIFGNVIRQDTVANVLDSGLVFDEYLVARHPLAIIVPAAEDGSFPENWEEVTGYDRETENIIYNFRIMQPLLAFNDMEMFLTENSMGYIDAFPGVNRTLDDGSHVEDLVIDFAYGHNEHTFVFTEGDIIPIIISERTAETHGLDFGDVIFINHILMDQVFNVPRHNHVEFWEYIPIPAVIVGTHNRNILGLGMQESALIPLSAMEYILGSQIGYITFQFNIDPMRNRELPAAREELENIAERFGAGWAPLGVLMHDEELRVVAGSMEQNLSLLGLLYPVAIAVSIAIGFGLVLLLMLQNAKNAAIMRVLGSTKRRTRAVLCTEQLIVCLLGIIIGLAAVTILGWSIGAAVMLAGLYLAGTAVGSAAGSILVTNRPPLELLQVKE
jgi:hypothetical protein